MTSERFNAIVAGARQRQDAILKTKGADYTRHEADRLSNFKRAGAALGLPATKVWAIYFLKHIDALVAFIKTGKAESEAIEGRFDDITNYILLLEGLLEDLRAEKGDGC